MGIMDLPKLAMKARQMQSQMSKTKAAGKHGTIAIIINGLYSIIDREPDMDALAEKFPNIERNELERLVNLVLSDVTKALDDAKGNLQKDMASNTSMDDIKSMLGS